MRNIAILALTISLLLPATVMAKSDGMEIFKITAYSYSEGYGENYQTASGELPIPYRTVVVDPSIIKLGTVLYIEGIGEVVATDTGGAVKGNVIDLHIGYDETENFGVKHRKVKVVD